MYKSLLFTLTLSVFSSISLNLFAQNVNITPSTPSSPSNTVTIPPQSTANPGTGVPSPADFPSYTVRPSEDLNPYGLSSLDSSTENDYRNEPGTLGTNTKRTTNSEVNKAIIEKKKAEKEKQEEGIDEPGITTLEKELKPPTESQSVTKNYKKTKLISWTDENGNVHVTNDIGNVPQRYMDSVQYR